MGTSLLMCPMKLLSDPASCSGISPIEAADAAGRYCSSWRSAVDDMSCEAARQGAASCVLATAVTAAISDAPHNVA